MLVDSFYLAPLFTKYLKKNMNNTDYLSKVEIANKLYIMQLPQAALYPHILLQTGAV